MGGIVTQIQQAHCKGEQWIPPKQEQVDKRTSNEIQKM